MSTIFAASLFAQEKKGLFGYFSNKSSYIDLFTNDLTYKYFIMNGPDDMSGSTFACFSRSMIADTVKTFYYPKFLVKTLGGSIPLDLIWPEMETHDGKKVSVHIQMNVQIESPQAVIQAYRTELTVRPSSIHSQTELDTSVLETRLIEGFKNAIHLSVKQKECEALCTGKAYTYEAWKNLFLHWSSLPFGQTLLQNRGLSVVDVNKVEIERRPRLAPQIPSSAQSSSQTAFSKPASQSEPGVRPTNSQLLAQQRLEAMYEQSWKNRWPKVKPDQRKQLDKFTDDIRERIEDHPNPLKLEPISSRSCGLGTGAIRVLQHKASLAFSFTATANGFLTVINLGTSGDITLLLPNSIVAPNGEMLQVQTGERYRFPVSFLPQFDSDLFIENDKQGLEGIYVFITPQPLFPDIQQENSIALTPLSGQQIAKIVDQLDHLAPDQWTAGAAEFIVIDQ